MTSAIARSAAALAMLGLGLAGCETLAPDRPIVLSADIAAPASVDAGQAFVATVTVHSGGCRSFEQLDATRVGSRVTFVGRGRDYSGPEISCTGDVRTNVIEYRVEPPTTDPVTLVAIQPNGTEVTRTVRVLTR
jgi:hypothetical protein